jgi:hypothetical protein
MELEHIKKCKEFKVTVDPELPLKKLKDGTYILRESTAIDLERLNKRLEKIRDRALGLHRKGK